MTIREAIDMYLDKWAHMPSFKKYKNNIEILQHIDVCVTIPLKSGHEIFIDNYKYDKPNKNGVFKRLSFTIELDDNGENTCFPKVPDNISYTTRKYKWCDRNKIDLYFHKIKERDINSFILSNGGVDKDKYIVHLNKLFDSINEMSGLPS